MNQSELLLRIGLAALFGAVVGLEREWRHKNAGVKTNTLVAIGSAIFALLSDTFGRENHNPAQLAAAVVSGIGFIGAGVIIHRGANVQGVTTAATLWANASMGVAIGLGHFVVGIAAVIGIVIVQFGLRNVVDSVGSRKHPRRRIELEVELDEGALAAVNQAWTSWATESRLVAARRTLIRREGRLLWKNIFSAPAEDVLSLSTIQERLAAIPGVTRIETGRPALEEHL